MIPAMVVIGLFVIGAYSYCASLSSELKAEREYQREREKHYARDLDDWKMRVRDIENALRADGFRMVAGVPSHWEKS